MRIRSQEPGDANGLLDIWHRAVCQTHRFLTADDIQSLLPIVRDEVFPPLNLWVLCSAEEEAIGFLGVGAGRIESLFIDPAHLRQGGGRMLVEFARALTGRLQVDVNEQNVEARRFYEAMGFEVVGRSPVDDAGRPFPIVHMKEGPGG